jgi:hypothetical protein
MQVLGYTGTFIIMLEKYLKINGGEFMREVYNGLWCGDDKSYAPTITTGEWAEVFAAKEPMHRHMVGYTSRGCPKDSPYYFFIERGNVLALNIVDAPDPIFFDKGMIDKALDFIGQKLSEGRSVQVRCNEGRSRSASICLLYLIKHGIIKGNTFEDCEALFMQIYPEYNPGAGIRGFIKEHWSEYVK